jgi:hypothetical protein
VDSDHRFGDKPTGRRGHPVAVKGLVDAKAKARAHPDTFSVPSEAKLKKIKPGDLVKVARNNERFWVRVTGFEKRRIHGTVANSLIRNDDLPFGTSIYLSKKNIYSWVPKEEAVFI